MNWDELRRVERNLRIISTSGNNQKIGKEKHIILETKKCLIVSQSALFHLKLFIDDDDEPSLDSSPHNGGESRTNIVTVKKTYLIII